MHAAKLHVDIIDGFVHINKGRLNIYCDIWFRADVCNWGLDFIVKARFLCWYLVRFLVEAGGHLQQRAAFIQRRGEGLPLLLQLPGDLLDLLRGVMARLQEPVPDWHDPVDVHVHILGRTERQTHTIKLLNSQQISASRDKLVN